MTVFRAATLRTFFFAFHAGAKELKVYSYYMSLLSCPNNNLGLMLGFM